MEKKKASGEVKLPEGVTPDMVKAWKERYGDDKVKLATLRDEDGEDVLDIVVRVPDRKTLGEFEKWIDKNPDKAKEIVVNACVLSNKDQVKTDEDLFLSAFDALAKLLPVRTSVIKNL